MSLAVQFTYYTGLVDTNFRRAWLLGSWDASGRYSNLWSEQEMSDLERSPDGGQAFRATVHLDRDQDGWTFHWGVSAEDGSGNRRWAICEEVNDIGSGERFCSFRLTRPSSIGVAQEISYYLSHGRRLGAQKFGDAISFAVWAPNARNVAVVMAALAKEPYGDSYINPSETPANQATHRKNIFGGFISDSGAGIQEGWGPFPMFRNDEGVWTTDLAAPDLQVFRRFDHAPYMFRVTKDDGSVAYRTDLYSRCQIGYGGQRPDTTKPWVDRTLDLDGTVSCSVAVDSDLITRDVDPIEPVWPETKWLPNAEFWGEEKNYPPRPRRIEDLVIYELHVGVLGFGKGEHQPGTIADAVRLLAYLKDLGVNAVELLPMSEFGGGGGGWGYATSHYFAIEYAGGGRDQYKWFIRECHRHGIAVILDVVYNHFNHHADRAEWMFDTNDHTRNPYYWYEGHPDDYVVFNTAVSPGERGQGGYVDNLSTAWAPRYWEPMVRRMFVSSALTQATEFRVDGFRMDQTTSIHAYNALHADGRSLGNVNSYGQKMLREVTRALKTVRPEIMLSAEDHSNWEGVTASPDEGGLGFDATWFADFYHHLIGDTDKGSDYAKLLKTAGLGDDRPLAMDYFAGALAATGGRKVVYNESHDEAGNGRFTERTICVAANGAPLFGDTRKYAESRCRFVAGVTLLCAGTPMFLFGEEVGSEKKFLYDHVLENREDYEALRRGSGSFLFTYYSQLIRLRLVHAGLRSRNIDVVFVHNEHRLILFHRWGEGEDFLVVASLNNRPFNSPSYLFRAERIPGGQWREVFNSDAAAFGGNNIGNLGRTMENLPGILECVVPANGVIVFQRET
jgi:1,4-alpha-glucan branching enzyme